MNMLRHVLAVLGMTSDRRAPRGLHAGGARRLRPGDRRARARATRATATTRRSRRSGAAVDGLLEPRAAVPRGLPRATRCCATGSGIDLAYKDIVFQGTQSRVDLERPRGERRLLQHLRRPAPATRCPTGVTRRGRPGDRRRPPGRAGRTSAAPVPRRVDPHRARLRPDPRPGPRPAAMRPSLPRVVVVDHHDSYTWNLVHLVAAVTGDAAGGRRARRGRRSASCRGVHATSCCRPGRAPRRRPRLRRSGRAVFALGAAGARGLPGHAGAWSRRTAVRSAQVEPAHGEVAVGEHDGTGVFAGIPSPFDGGALPLAGRDRGAGRARGDRVVRRAGRAGRDGRRAPRAAAGGVQFHPESILTEHGERLVANFLGPP